MAVAGLEIQAGQFVEIRGDAAMWNCIEAVSLAVERAEAVPCLNVTSIAHEADFAFGRCLVSGFDVRHRFCWTSPPGPMPPSSSSATFVD